MTLGSSKSLTRTRAGLARAIRTVRVRLRGTEELAGRDMMMSTDATCSKLVRSFSSTGIGAEPMRKMTQNPKSQ